MTANKSNNRKKSVKKKSAPNKTKAKPKARKVAVAGGGQNLNKYKRA